MDPDVDLGVPCVLLMTDYHFRWPRKHCCILAVRGSLKDNDGLITLLSYCNFQSDVPGQKMGWNKAEMKLSFKIFIYV